MIIDTVRCLMKCGKLIRVWMFLLFLLLTIGIFFTHTNRALFLAINGLHAIFPIKFMHLINFITDPRHLILSLLLLAITYVWRREKFFNIILLMIVFIVTFTLLKHLAHEARPYAIYVSNTFYFLPHSTMNYQLSNAYYSYPSGHVATITIFAFALCQMFFKHNIGLQIIALLLVIITALVRIMSGWHWPLDVLCAGLYSYILLIICLWLPLDKSTIQK